MQTINLNTADDPELAELGGLLSLSAHRGDLDDATRFKRIWLRVILQQFVDAGTLSHRQEALRLKEDARRWLTTGSTDFKMVCDYCGFEPEVIQRICKRIFNSPDCEAYLQKLLPNTRMNGKRAQRRGPKPKTIHDYKRPTPKPAPTIPVLVVSNDTPII